MARAFRAAPGTLRGFLTRTRGRHGLHWTDWLTYAYLGIGVVVMLGPVIWLLLSSVKTEAQIEEFPPRILPYGQEMAKVEGYPNPLPLFSVPRPDGTRPIMAEVRRIGLQAQMVDPKHPGAITRVNMRSLRPAERFHIAWCNFRDVFASFNFGLYLWNSVFITAVSTLITLLVNSMAAFALAKYEFRGRLTALAIIIATLMIPQTIVLVPSFIVVAHLGLINSLWGVILPGVATPTGVFLLRQYMLTIPDELIDAARMDKASEWRIYWRLVLPLSAPALAVLAIFAIMWRWNDFLWPLIVLTRSDKFTLQLALNSFQGESTTQWNDLLAMTVLTLLPMAAVFAFLQRYIQAGIASTGIK